MGMAALPLVEPSVVPEIHIEGIAYIDKVGDNLKIGYYSVQRGVGGDTYERVICCKLVISLENAKANNVEWQAELGRLSRREPVSEDHPLICH